MRPVAISANNKFTHSRRLANSRNATSREPGPPANRASYLRLLNLPRGLLINFGASTFKEGCKRIVRNHKDFASSHLRVNQNPKDLNL